MTESDADEMKRRAQGLQAKLDEFRRVRDDPDCVVSVELIALAELVKGTAKMLIVMAQKL